MKPGTGPFQYEQGRFRCKNHLWVGVDDGSGVERCIACGARRVVPQPSQIVKYLSLRKAN